ncbi:DUF3427 domain-containing protein, partial [Gordonia alkanivorans]|uniref:DUF3427 domain-containing protein n=1 Tax=Gordonia alkanivorans TaxID=84096 RepID=UPI00244C6FBE
TPNGGTTHLEHPAQGGDFYLATSGDIKLAVDKGPDLFVWSSQNSTKPEGKKGREILRAPATGKSIELWMRRKPSDPFTYLGRVIPLGREGSQPMTVKYRLLTPLSGELRRRLNFDEHNRA